MTGAGGDRLTGAWLTDPAPQAVFAALLDAGHRAYAVGGCVRNALLGVPVADVDIATDATPDQVMRSAAAAGLKSVPTGIDHGTVTIVSAGTGYEVTTFRADVQTDGRHAVVRYSDSLTEDARRRDFTMNALYADAAGQVIDPLGGRGDLAARRVRFVGDPARRIREDYLRILRFFRFCAWYGDPDLGFDGDALAAIADTLDGLAHLSRERVGAEVTRLLGAADPAPAVATMARTGVLHRLLPGTDAAALSVLVHAEQSTDTQPDAIRRLAALGPVDATALRLSRANGKRLGVLRDAVGSGMGAAELGYRHGADMARDVLLLRCALLEQPVDPQDIDRAATGAAAVMPVTAHDLMPDYSGPALGARLDQLERRWIASGFALSRAALLDS